MIITKRDCVVYFFAALKEICDRCKETKFVLKMRVVHVGQYDLSVSVYPKGYYSLVPVYLSSMGSNLPHFL